MNSAEQNTIIDLLFESRNKEYGSYRLRKQYYVRLAISFLIALAIFVLLVLGYSWYLYSAGDATVYLYSSSVPTLKYTQGSLLSAQELKSYMKSASPPDEQKMDIKSQPTTDEMHNFRITENATPDTFKPTANRDLPSEITTTSEFSNDSVIFGGFFPGEGMGDGSGSRVDRIPEFPGGSATKYVEMNLKYPMQAIRQKIHGVVIISFIINKSGKVVDVKVERGVNPIIDAEAIKTIESMPPWRPAMRHGSPINFRYMMPINFVPLS